MQVIRLCIIIADTDVPFCWRRQQRISWCLVLSSFCSCVPCVASWRSSFSHRDRAEEQTFEINFTWRQNRLRGKSILVSHPPKTNLAGQQFWICHYIRSHNFYRLFSRAALMVPQVPIWVQITGWNSQQCCAQTSSIIAKSLANMDNFFFFKLTLASLYLGSFFFA